MTLNYAAISGSVKVVLFDDRKESSTFNLVQEIFLSQDNYSLLVVPPLIWNGFKAIGNESAILANCATLYHKQDEIERLPYNDKRIPYTWEVKHK